MAEKMTLYPWLESTWHCLQAYQAQDRLPHALMITGPKGVGKIQLAQHFARHTLCEEGGDCGHCTACRLLAGQTHPDLRVLMPEPGKAITVDSIRDLIERLALKSHYGKGRVVIISSADRMNAASANSFLKTLEEPGPDNHILLICENPSLLPATIRSRCQHIKLVSPPEDIALAWLQAQGFERAPARLALALHYNAPLLAMAWLESDSPQKRQKFLAHWQALMERRHDPVALAEQWKEAPMEEVLSWCVAITSDLIRLALGVEDRVTNLDCQALLQKYAKQLNLRNLMDFWRRLLAAKEDCRSQVNRQLMLESLFIETHRLTS